MPIILKYALTCSGVGHIFHVERLTTPPRKRVGQPIWLLFSFWDHVPAITAEKELCPDQQVIVYVPTRNRVCGAAVELRSAADKDRTLPNGLFRRSQFAPKVPDGDGGWIEKPASW